MQSRQSPSQPSAGLSSRLARGGEISKSRSPTRSSGAGSFVNLWDLSPPLPQSSQGFVTPISRHLNLALSFVSTDYASCSMLQDLEHKGDTTSKPSFPKFDIAFSPAAIRQVPAENVHAFVARHWSVAIIPNAQGNLHPT